jgi:hypothetical protein
MKKILIPVILLLVLWGCDNDPELTTNIDTASVSGTLSLEQASVDTIAVLVKMVHQLDDAIWQEVEPDSSGFFLMEGLTPGEYDFSIAIDSRHYADYFDELTLFKDKNENLETISMTRIENNCSIVGQISFDNLNLVSDVTIDIYYLNKANDYVMDRTIFSDSTGFFYEEGLFPGDHKLEFQTEHYPVYPKILTLPHSEPINITFEEIALMPYHTVQVDGDISDWGEPLYENTNDSNWSSLNEYHFLYLAYDDSNLYLGLEATYENQNSLNLYFDIDYGDDDYTGIHDFSSINDNIANGKLKKNVTVVSDFGADVALCLWDDSSSGVFNLESSQELNSNIIRQGDYIEVAIPLADLYDAGVIPENTKISIVALIGGGETNSMANDTIPQQSEEFGTDDNPQFDSVFTATFEQPRRK